MPVMSKEECRISSLSARVHALEVRIENLRKENQELKEALGAKEKRIERLQKSNLEILKNNHAYITANREFKEKCEKLRKQFNAVFNSSIKRAKILELIKWAIDGKIVLDTSSRACKEAGSREGVVKKVK